MLRKYDLLSRVKKRTYFFIYMSCVVLTWLSKIGIGAVTSSLMGKPFVDDMFVNYISPTMVLAASCFTWDFFWYQDEKDDPNYQDAQSLGIWSVPCTYKPAGISQAFRQCF